MSNEFIKYHKYYFDGKWVLECNFRKSAKISSSMCGRYIFFLEKPVEVWSSSDVYVIVENCDNFG